MSYRRYAGRQLRRAPLLTLALLLAIAGGSAAAVASLSLVAGGSAHPVPGRAPIGMPIPVPTVPTLPFSLAAREASADRPMPPVRRSVVDEALPRTIRSAMEESVGQILATLSGIAGVILALCVATTALLLLSRAFARRREMAMRSVLGATPRNIFKQVNVEGGALGVLGLGLGMAGAWGGIALMRSTLPDDLVIWLAHPWSGRVLAVGAGVPLLAALAFSAAPAIFALGPELHARVAGGERATAGPGAGGVRRALTILGVGSSYALLCAALFLLRGFAGTDAVASAGFDPRDTLVVQLSSSEVEATDRAASYESLLSRIAAEPGVRAESLSSQGAWIGLGTTDDVHVLTGDPVTPGVMRAANYHAVSPAYFRSLGIPLVSGREFTPQDRAGSRAVVMVNETFAHTVLPFLDPVGKYLQLGGVGLHQRWYTVVGVVRDPRATGIGATAEPAPAIYLPILQAPPPDVSLAVRTAGNPLDTLPAVQRAIHDLVPGSTVYETGTMEQALAKFRAPLGWFGSLFVALAVFTTILAAVGLYGVVAYQVERRERELGIRMALGARSGAVVRMVLREGMRVTSVGLVLGIAAALCLGRLLQFFFPAIRIGDPIPFLLVALLISTVALLASVLPARAAARVDPAIALRAE